MKIELLYFDGCPHYELFAHHLDQLISTRALRGEVERVRVQTNEQAHALRFLGSPSLRVNGDDVDPSASTRTDYGMQCRLYAGPDGYQGMPPDEWIMSAVQRCQREMEH